MYAVIFEVVPKPGHTQDYLDWKNNPLHRAAQAKGIKEYFKDFRIRVAQVERDYALADRLSHSRFKSTI